MMFAVSGFPQFYSGMQMTFGKNRVQYSDEKLWSYFRFSQFDTYFYQNGRELAIQTAKYAEDILPVMEKKIEFTLEGKIQFVIFTSLSDFKESNIGLTREDAFNVGGVTQVTGNKVALYFEGNYRDFYRQIRQGIARILVEQMLYGEQITANIKNSALLFLPGWYIEGLISYLAEDWNTTIDNIARNGFMTGKYKKFNFLSGQDAVIAGHSIWKYIRDKYGDDVIPNIVYLTKLSRSVENGFLFVLGTSFKTAVAEWEQYYLENYRQDINGRTLPDEGALPLLKKQRKELHLHELALNPQRTKVVYATDELNKKKIYLHDIATGKRKVLFKIGHKIDEMTDFSYPLIAWHPSGELLAFVLERKGIIMLYYYIVETGIIEKQAVFGVDKIHDMSYSSDGQSLLVSATINGQSDIFLYQLASKTFEHITKDAFDDLQPRFVLNGNYIAFSSDRISDTLVFAKETFIRDYNEKIIRNETYCLFLYNFKTRSPVLRKIEGTSGGDAFMPQAYEKQNFIFLSDANGIMNRYLAQPDSAISHIDTVIHYRYNSVVKPLTDYPSNIIEHGSFQTERSITELIQYENKRNTFIRAYSDIIAPPLPTVYKKQFMQRQPISNTNTFEAETHSRQSYPIVPQDTSGIDVENYVFRTIERVAKDSLPKEPAKIDTVPADSAKKIFVLPKQLNVNVEYAVNELINQVDYSYLNYSYQLFTGGGPVYFGNGINAFLKIGATDLLEDYRLIGGVRLSFDLQNNEYLVGFENYKSRLNKQWLFHRQSNSLQVEGENTFVKYRLHDVHYILTYPFSPVFAVKTSLMLRNDIMHYLSTDYQNLIKPSGLSVWGGAKSELIFDNTRNPQMNIYFGSRAKWWIEYMQSISKEKINLVVLGMDVRHYLPIDRNFIWANRLAASSSMGNSKLIYYMGGVDNWLFPKFNNNIQVAMDKQYMYQTIATNMRGFQQNIRNGNSFAAVNSELRFPVFRYFYNRPLRSQVLNNFQIVGFGDIGTAWEGWNPFSEDNSLFTSVVSQKPITVIVRRQKNPIVGGFGYGLRTTLLGYFIRADYAWGVEDGKLTKPQFYISLSLDF